MQDVLISGDTLNFSISVADYPASASWELKYRLVPRTAANPAITITSVADTTTPADHRVQVAASTTATWAADNYTWHSYATKALESYSVDRGQLVVSPNPRTVATGYDGRSAAVVGLEAVRAVLRGTASAGILSYSIAGRTLQRYSMTELLQLEASLVAQVKSEERALDMAAGLADKTKIHVRMGRA